MNLQTSRLSLRSPQMTRIRTAALSLAFVGAALAGAPAAFAQSETTVAAVAETSAAAVAETTAAAEAVAPASEAVAPASEAGAPAGGVAAGGGFLSDEGGTNTLPIVLAGAAVVAGAGVFAARRRRA
jgi:LPXTG-motif cell wall-anchored protein